VTSWQSLNYSKKKSAPLRIAKIHNRVNNSLTLDPNVKPVRIPTSYFNIIPLSDRFAQITASWNAVGPTRCTALHLDQHAAQHSIWTNTLHSPPFGPTRSTALHLDQHAAQHSIWTNTLHSTPFGPTRSTALHLDQHAAQHSIWTNTLHSPPTGHYRVRTADRRSSMFRLQLYPAYSVLSGPNILHNSWSQTVPPWSLNHSKQQAKGCKRPRRPEECVELYSLQYYFVVSSLQLETGTVRFNPLTQDLIWIINIQSLPCSKHAPSLLHKPVS